MFKGTAGAGFLQPDALPSVFNNNSLADWYHASSSA